jgi:hypothetical protein
MNQRIKIQNPPHKSSSDKKTSLHPDIPQLPFFVGIIGPRHRGKTVLLHNLLDKKQKDLYGNFFKKENIILYSPTYAVDDTLHDLKLHNVYSSDTDINWLIGEIKSQQEEYRSCENMAPVLLVMEDITQIRDAFVGLETLAYTGRHYNIQVLYIAHKMSSIFRGIRTQTQQWILFEPHEQSEWEYVLEMFSRRKTALVWENALKRAWKKPYNFVYIDFEKKEFNEIYKSGFHDPLFTPKEEAQINSIYPDFQGQKAIVNNSLDTFENILNPIQ